MVILNQFEYKIQFQLSRPGTEINHIEIISLEAIFLSVAVAGHLKKN